MPASGWFESGKRNRKVSTARESSRQCGRIPTTSLAPHVENRYPPPAFPADGHGAQVAGTGRRQARRPLRHAIALEGDTLHFTRSGVDGHIALQPDSLHVTAQLGFLLSAMKGSIEQEIRRVLDEKFA
jgi:putative polyhydroxyalkanoate system protein